MHNHENLNIISMLFYRKQSFTRLQKFKHYKTKTTFLLHLNIFHYAIEYIYS
jgi:hypothetical protein